MDSLVPILAALLASSATAPPAASVPPRSTAIRFDDAASRTVTVRARIVRGSARVGDGLGPPAPHMLPRRGTVTAADGRLVPAVLYDFE